MKAQMIYLAMLGSATGLYHAVAHLQAAAEAPILAIARQQQQAPWGAWSATPGQGAAAVAAYRAATGADEAAVRGAERKEFAP
jgi:hypothetical protein